MSSFFMDYYANYRFFVPGGCSCISHLLFLGDIVVFCNSSGQAIKTIFQVIVDYDICSSQRVHKTKSVKLCQSNAPISRISIMEVASGISKSSLPFIYLGIPIVMANVRLLTLMVLLKKLRKNCFTG